jgi:Leu/Phe-tRNA-protein transferase
LQSYIPPYLSRYIRPSHGDFCYTPFFHPRLIAQLMTEGFLPIACPDFLLPKLHLNRCVIAPVAEKLHVSKSTRKKAARFSMTINQNFDGVVAGCHQQFGQQCWLYPPLVDAFRTIHQHTVGLSKNETGSDPAKCFYPTVIVEDASSSSSSSSHDLALRRRVQRQIMCPVRLYSIEVWNRETGALVAGELGYSVGSIYTSLTGFSAEDSAGSVQLAALGRLLCQRGFTVWDLGMEMEYKAKLGSHLMSRDEFVETVHAVRETQGHLHLPVIATADRLPCREVIDARPGEQTDSSTASLPNSKVKPPPSKKARAKR